VSRGDFALSCPARTPAASGGDPARWTGHPSGGRGPATLRAATGPSLACLCSPFWGEPGDFALSCPARTPAASGGDARPLDRPPFGGPWAGHPSGGGRVPSGLGRALSGGGRVPFGRRPGPLRAAAGSLRVPAGALRALRVAAGAPSGGGRGPFGWRPGQPLRVVAGPSFGEGGNGGRLRALTRGKHSGVGSVVRCRDSRIVVIGPEPPAGSGSG
jgi:hypothetical protein